MRFRNHPVAKLSRVIRYGAVALVGAWSLLAITAYAALSLAAGWLGGLAIAGGWIAWSGQTIEQIGGPIITIVWLIGAFVIFGAMAVLRRLTT